MDSAQTDFCKRHELPLVSLLWVKNLYYIEKSDLLMIYGYLYQQSWRLKELIMMIDGLPLTL